MSVYTEGCHCQQGPDGQPISRTADEIPCHIHAATEQPAAYPGYATPTFFAKDGGWYVTAAPWERDVGFTNSCNAGWIAVTMRGLPVGLFPTQQAAGEALVVHAGYEVLR